MPQGIGYPQRPQQLPSQAQPLRRPRPQQAGGLFGGPSQRLGARPQGLPAQAAPRFNPLSGPQSFLPGLLPNQALQRNRLLNRNQALPNFNRPSPWRPSFAPQGQPQGQPFASPWFNTFNRRFF